MTDLNTDPLDTEIAEGPGDGGGRVSTPDEIIMLPAHLDVTQSSRGFDHLPPIPSEYGGIVRVYVSSAATGPSVWLCAVAPVDLNDPTGPAVDATMHLTAEDAWHLAEQLMTLVRDHYQGDARPDQRVADFRSTVDTAAMRQLMAERDDLRGVLAGTARERNALERQIAVIKSHYQRRCETLTRARNQAAVERDVARAERDDARALLARIGYDPEADTWNADAIDKEHIAVTERHRDRWRQRFQDLQVEVGKHAAAWDRHREQLAADRKTLAWLHAEKVAELDGAHLTLDTSARRLYVARAERDTLAWLHAEAVAERDALRALRQVMVGLIPADMKAAPGVDTPLEELPELAREYVRDLRIENDMRGEIIDEALLWIDEPQDLTEAGQLYQIRAALTDSAPAMPVNACESDADARRRYAGENIALQARIDEALEMLNRRYMGTPDLDRPLRRVLAGQPPLTGDAPTGPAPDLERATDVASGLGETDDTGGTE
jgi:hypothetical protein